MISTYSLFYYINPVNESNFYLNFNEGAGELTAEIQVGSFSPSTLAFYVATAMNTAGTQGYTVVFDRETRKFTISATANFSLLVSSGTQVGADIFSLLGFTGADRTGSNSYTGNLAAGSAYEPQFKLQDYVDIEDLQKSSSASVNKAANGAVEVVKFGIEKFFEFNIKFITDIDQGKSSPIKTNLSGLASARSFMRFIVNKGEIEFMPDIGNKSIFYTVILESTPEDSNGVGYRLKELYGQGLPFYFETGKLVFRLVED